MRRSPATAPGRRRRLIRTGCPRNCRGAGEGPAAVVWDECAPCAARHSERSGADCGKSLRGGGLSARDVPGPAGERENVRQRSFGTNVRPAQRGIPKGTAPTAGNPSAANAFPHGMSPDPAAGSGRTSGSGCLGRMCALRSAAFRKERCRLREIPPRRRLIRTGCPRNLPGSRRTSGSGGRRRVRKTAGSRKIDENLIFGTRAFVFYPLSLAAPKILRLNKIANKFAFVSGLFVSLRLKPKYANRP